MSNTAVAVSHPPSSKDFLTTLRDPGPERLKAAASLLGRGVDVNGVYEFPSRYPSGPVISHHQVTALYDAAMRGDYEAVQFLLSSGTDARARNQTFCAVGPLVVAPANIAETLCGLDGMRTSKDRMIVELAEEKFGVETEEEFVRRRDAFDGLLGYYPRNTKTGTLVKPTIKRVKSVLQGYDAIKKRNRSQDIGHGNKRKSDRRTDRIRQQRYELRPRK